METESSTSILLMNNQTNLTKVPHTHSDEAHEKYNLIFHENTFHIEKVHTGCILRITMVSNILKITPLWSIINPSQISYQELNVYLA